MCQVYEQETELKWSSILKVTQMKLVCVIFRLHSPVIWYFCYSLTSVKAIQHLLSVTELTEATCSQRWVGELAHRCHAVITQHQHTKDTRPVLLCPCMQDLWTFYKGNGKGRQWSASAKEANKELEKGGMCVSRVGKEVKWGKISFL